MDTIALILIIVAAAILFFFWLLARSKRSGRTGKLGRFDITDIKAVEVRHGHEGKSAGENVRILELRQDLRRKVLYDEDKIERLVQFERERMPTASLEECLVAAIQRWERENR